MSDFIHKVISTLIQCYYENENQYQWLVDMEILTRWSAVIRLRGIHTLLGATTLSKLILPPSEKLSTLQIIQSNLVISNSLISNSRLSRIENLVPVLKMKL